MSYEPKTWVTGEVITASDLNHMENAIGSFYVTIDTSGASTVLSASYNEILSEISKGKLCVYMNGNGVMHYLSQLVEIEGSYTASFSDIGGSSVLEFGAVSADENMTEATT